MAPTSGYTILTNTLRYIFLLRFNFLSLKLRTQTKTILFLNKSNCDIFHSNHVIIDFVFKLSYTFGSLTIILDLPASACHQHCI
jgi:hypothetical protein